MVVILFLFILTVNNSSFSLIHTCYLLFWSSLQCDLEKEYELQNFLYVWIIKSSHPPNLLWYLVMVFSRFLLFAWTCRLEKSLGEHVYIAFRLGIMSKLKTKWLLSKTSAFNVGFIFKEKEHILASEMQTACLIQVNLVNSPSPCLVQRNEAFCPVWVALLVPSACDHRGVASPLQPCLLVLPQAFLTLTECSYLLPAPGFNFPAALRQSLPAGCAAEIQYLRIRLFFISKPFLLMASNLTFLYCDQAVFIWGWSLMLICIFLEMQLFWCSKDEEHCLGRCTHWAPINSGKSPSVLAVWALLSVQWVLLMDKQQERLWKACVKMAVPCC